MCARNAMGHDIHFLKRLERVSLPQVELAMSLYNDSPLVAFVLHHARLPESAESVAISLGDPELGPFVIVARTGHFVTCLAEGMRVEPGTPVLTRQRLDAILDKVEDYRERVEQAYKLAGNKGRVHQLLRRIYTAADDLTREEFIGLSAWSPLLRREFLSQLLGSMSELEMARRTLRKLDKVPKQYEGALREYWNLFWAMGHLALLLGDDIREFLESIPTAMTELTGAGLTISWSLVRQGFVPQALRGAWLASKLGRLGVPVYKNAFERAQTDLQMTDSALGLVALASRHSSVRGEIRKTLQRQIPEDGTPLNAFLRAVLEAARFSTAQAFDSPEQYQLIITEMGRRTYLRLAGEAQKGAEIPPEQLEGVRDDLILPSLAWLPFCFLRDFETTLHAFMLMPYAARAQPEDFYYPQADLGSLRRPWHPEDSLRLLRSYRDRYEGGGEKPIRAPQSPGRNDVCPCGSGKKYKRCCIDTSAPSPAP